MNVLIVEDETAASENLRRILSEMDDSLDVKGVTESVSQTVQWLQTHDAPDLIFMDIHLSDGSAFHIFQMITVETPIIFTTAYDEYALDAFRVNSIDYILKPVDTEALRRAIEKFRKLTKRGMQEYVTQQAQLTPTGKYIQKILIPVKDKLVPVTLSDVSFFYTTESNTTVHLRDGKVYPYTKTLDSVMQHLNPDMFFRANKQFIIARESVTNITVWFDSRLLVSLDAQMPERLYVSKNRASDFKKWMVG